VFLFKEDVDSTDANGAFYFLLLNRSAKPGGNVEPAFLEPAGRSVAC